MNKIAIANMHVGESGSGKTHLLCTFPKCFILSTEPNHHWVWMLNPELKKNVIYQKYYIPDKETFKDMFINIEKDIQLAKEMHAKGEIETLGIDNLTYLVHNRWIWLNQFQRIVNRAGDLDTRGMYGNLRTWCYNFMLMQIMSFKGNVVCNVHEMVEGDEALEKKVDKTITYTPNLLGGFRNDIDGLFSNVFYLSKLVQANGTYKYMCRTNKGNHRLAKNRFNLPTVIEDVNYGKIRKAIEEHTK